MNKVILSLLLSFGLLNLAQAASGNADAGKAKSATCAACHGADGNSMVPMYPTLAGQNATYLIKQLTDFKAGATSGGKKGRNNPIMGGMAMALSTQDMADLAAYFSANKRKQSTAKTNKLGHKLYFGGDVGRAIPACVACHGKTGLGMPAAGFPSLASQHTQYLVTQLTQFRSGDRANDANSVMRKVTNELTDNEIKHLAGYISSIKLAK